MLISKFDLYNPEWLELVFNNRNKEYGAYELRRHYNRNMVMAMGGTFSIVALLFCAQLVFHSSHNAPPLPVEDHHVIQLAHPPATHVDPPKPPAAEHPLPPQHPVATLRNPTPVVAPDPIAQTPPTVAQLEHAVSGTETVAGTPASGGTPLPATAGTGDAPAPVVDPNAVHDPFGLDVMPAPVGGEAAWMKFLSRNLRYPEQAQADGVSGRVFMSFIVEKDGTLSNIKVERGAGNGFDEEATRVLKMAKAWKPGMQNGQPVRVKYVIPINFQAAEQP
jgi:protein TonB